MTNIGKGVLFGGLTGIMTGMVILAKYNNKYKNIEAEAEKIKQKLDKLENKEKDIMTKNCKIVTFVIDNLGDYVKKYDGEYSDIAYGIAANMTHYFDNDLNLRKGVIEND